MPHEGIIKKFKKVNGCWNWLGSITEKGYGIFTVKKKHIKAHRYFYEFFVGKIPPELQIDHLCKNRKCVNPKHLELVTVRENNIRAGKIQVKNRTHCPSGHPYSGENLFYKFNRKTNYKWRGCRTCERQRKKPLS